MGVDPELLRGLERAVVDQPEDRPLRLHLAASLLENGQCAAALGHCEVLLGADAGDLDAQHLAVQARESLGFGLRMASDSADESRVKAWADEEEVPRVDALWDLLRPAVTLDDVVGMAQAKERLRVSFLEPMRNEDLRRAFGASLGGGLLLWGPPGCGKTHLARAVAGELGVYFLSVGLPDVLDMWLGGSEKNLHDLFETARSAAPAVLFVDEIDALGHRRAGFSSDSAGRRVVNQFLAELDGVETSNEGVFVLGATNRPWDLDPALRRPGRFDRMLLVLPPDCESRTALLAQTLSGRPVGQVDLAAIAGRTETMSGADLVHVCDTAVEYAMAASVRSGTVVPVTQADLERAVGEVAPSTADWFRSARAFAEVSGTDPSHAELLAYARRHRF